MCRIHKSKFEITESNDSYHMTMQSKASSEYFTFLFGAKWAYVHYIVQWVDVAIKIRTIIIFVPILSWSLIEFYFLSMRTCYIEYIIFAKN